MNFNRVAVCGSHSCGKTTLINELKKHMMFETHPLIAELAAKVDPKLRLKMESQFQIMQRQVIAEVTYTKNYGKFLSDRSVIDNLAYSTLVNKSINKNDGVYRKCISLAYSHIYSLIPPYDLLIFVDEILPYKEAEHRNFSTYREQEFIYEFIKNEISKIKIPIVYIKGSTNQRLSTIFDFISNNQNK
jgi:nicotinamide riboside kinase